MRRDDSDKAIEDRQRERLLSRARFGASCLHLLGLPMNELMVTLPAINQACRYQISHEGRTTDSPFYMLCSRTFHAGFAVPLLEATGDTTAAHVELHTFLEMMLEAPEWEYCWYPDKTTFVVSGPRDDAWQIARRLARQAIGEITPAFRNAGPQPFLQQLERHLIR